MFDCMHYDQETGMTWFTCCVCGEAFAFHHVTPLTMNEVVCNSVPCLRQVAIDRTIDYYDLKYRVERALEEE